MQAIVSILVRRRSSLFAIQISEFRKTDRHGYAAASSGVRRWACISAKINRIRRPTLNPLVRTACGPRSARRQATWVVRHGTAPRRLAWRMTSSRLSEGNDGFRSAGPRRGWAGAARSDMHNRCCILLWLADPGSSLGRDWTEAVLSTMSLRP